MLVDYVLPVYDGYGSMQQARISPDSQLKMLESIID
jgi:hypothetical protein